MPVNNLELQHVACSKLWTAPVSVYSGRGVSVIPEARPYHKTFTADHTDSLALRFPLRLISVLTAQ
jgi:hypothetical protein